MQFQVLKIAKFEFKVTVHRTYGQNTATCDPLTGSHWRDKAGRLSWSPISEHSLNDPQL